MPLVITPETDPNLTGGTTLEADLGHVEQGLSRLIERWRADRNPNLAALLTSYLEECQELEEAIFGVLFGRMLDYAEGANLDVLGRIVGQPRLGEADETYRLRIHTRIRINRSIGTPLDIIEVLQMLTAADFRFAEEGTAAFQIYVDGLLENTALASVLPKLLQDTRAAGVSGLIEMVIGGRAAFHGSEYDLLLHADVGHSSEYDSTVGGLHGHAIRA